MAKIPSYAEAVEALASCLGIVSNRDEKLTEVKSYVGKQKRYQDRSAHAASGLLPDLVAMLAGSSAQVQDTLKHIFSQYENLFAYLQGRALFSPQPQDKATRLFLLCWVYPQLAALLHELREQWPADSPLRYLERLLPQPGQQHYDPVATFRAELKSRIPADIGATALRTTVDKLRQGSVRKYTQIVADIRAFKECFSVAEAARSKALAEELQAVYIAGTAVQRAAEMEARRLPGSASGLDMLRHHLQDLAEPQTAPPGMSLAQAHVFILRRLRGSLMPDYVGSRAVQEVLRCYDYGMGRRDPQQQPEVVEIEALLAALAGVDVALVRQKIAALAQAEAMQWLQPVLQLLAGKLALVEGDPAVAYDHFRAVVEASKKQQCGPIAYEAAGHAIALKLLLHQGSRRGSLDALVLACLDNVAQEMALQVGHPTPFHEFDQPVELDSAELAIAGAIRDFNKWCERSGSPLFYNPLAKLDAMVASYFAHRDYGCDVPTAAERAFPKPLRRRTVFPMHAVVPYGALKDIHFYLVQFFHLGPQYLELNPALERYLGISRADKLDSLQQLDPVAFAQDEARLPWQP